MDWVKISDAIIADELLVQFLIMYPLIHMISRKCYHHVHESF